MTERIKALVVHNNSETLATLKGALERQGMHIIHAQSRAQAKRVLGGRDPVPLVFTETHLPDGTWADILAVAEKAALPVNVIVVARIVDTRFYVEAIETGAFDFLAPPFNATDLAYVVRSALDNAVARRAARPHSVHTAEEVLLAEVGEISAQATTN
ncbi:MAG: response regulator [Terriglobia bacterium]|jgi:DNA-binding NtrC family response regulator